MRSPRNSPIALVYHAVPHVVMLATPADLEDYAVGFTLSEGLVARPEEIRSVEVEAGPHAIDVRISIAWERFSALLQQRRNLTGRTGCGLCGAETVEQAIRTPAPLTGGVKVSERGSAHGPEAARIDATAERAHRQRACRSLGTARSWNSPRA